MVNKSIFFRLVIYLITVNISFSQESHGGLPLTYFDKYSKLYTGNLSSKKININGYNLPVIDNKVESERAYKIKEECSTCKYKSYYGKGIDVAIDIKSAATLKILDDGSKIWLYKVNSSNAFALQFYFDKFKLPEGSKLFFYNEDKSMLLGSFTEKNNPKNPNQKIPFGTQYISGNSIYIEYYEPKNVEFDTELHITKVIHVFKDVFHKENGPFGNSLPCEIDASCPLGIGWKDEISSVALILAYDSNNELGAMCSGALMNNTSQNGDPLFLTANHCIDGTSSEYDNNTWIFLFNHQNPDCNGGSFISSSLTESIYGSLMLTSDASGSPTSDWCLLRLLTTVQTLTSYKVCYAGWDRIESNASSSPYTFGIHHPNGDIKKISKSNTSPISVCTNNNYWEANWSQGLTEPGSSGSPLFNQYHRVIGQLYGQCNNAIPRDCVNPQHSDYGKFSSSWANSGAGGLAFYLDPFFTGATYVNSYCPANVNTCNNGIWDIGSGEQGVDCGGPCIVSCPGGNVTSNCHNGIRDGNETGVDCGGSCLPCGNNGSAGGGLGYPKPISDDDHSCNAHYETFENPQCKVDVSTFDITNPNTFTRAFLTQPYCIQGEWNALHGRPALIPGYNNIGLYLWGYIYQINPGGIADYFGSDLFFTNQDNFLSNRTYTVSFYAKALRHNNDIFYADLVFFLANGLQPNSDNNDYIMRIQWPYTGTTTGSYSSNAGTVNFNLKYIGTYNHDLTEEWHYYKFTFVPPNNNYNQLIFFPVDNQYTQPTTSEYPTARIFLDNIAICAECTSQQPNVTYNNTSVPSATYATNITAQNTTIASNQTVKFVADNEIILNNNFTTSNGSDFVGRIKGCSFNSAKLNNPDNIIYIDSTDSINITPQEIFSYKVPKPMHLKGKEYLTDFHQSDIAIPEIYQNLVTTKTSERIDDLIINPNPNTGVFQLHLKHNMASEISIYDIMGQLVYQTRIINNITAVDLSDQSKGIYFIKVKQGNKIYNEKLIIQ